jgi:hypothetical protein
MADGIREPNIQLLLREKYPTLFQSIIKEYDYILQECDDEFLVSLGINKTFDLVPTSANIMLTPEPYTGPIRTDLILKKIEEYNKVITMLCELLKLTTKSSSGSFSSSSSDANPDHDDGGGSSGLSSINE